ncbi:hypothetical protein QO259_01310 [Salinicola sp. JS01]|uniref:hypothetical protein n=1 Tax=Salinicola sp. JS01 TaxID=3050071 RepID=UPI00255C1C83|nr:hypothetical protein [Salinicola sp. JS01]WIX33325.1 hypothetical protein QO259_01310 [Salinicola sp. JS01]
MAIVFTITDAGRAALIDADHDGTTALTLSEIGFGRGRYTPSADQTALREPIKRLASMAGQAVAADTLHVSVQDESSDTYAVGEIGLFTDTGVLFAVYSQSEWIIEKAAPSTLLLATDLVVESLDVSSITFGDAAFLNPPATTEVAGVLELATQAEVDAGSDARRGVVPRTLKAFIDKVLAAYATLKQLNDHAASRNHPAATTNAQGMVELATYAETKEGSDNARAVTPAANKSALDAHRSEGGAHAATRISVENLAKLGNPTTVQNALGALGTAARRDEGPGKGLDADKLDGLHAADFVRDVNGNASLEGTQPTLLFKTNGGNDQGGVRFNNPTGNDGELEFFTSDDYAEPFVFRAYDRNDQYAASDARREWARIDNAGIATDATLRIQGKEVYHPGNASDLATIAGTNDLRGVQLFRSITKWAVDPSSAAVQRADARGDGTQARLHWYGEDQDGKTANFRHAWYDGSKYINVTAESGHLEFEGIRPWITLQSPNSGDNALSQGAGISVGEGGRSAGSGAAIHMTYVGDGSGHIGMGAVGDDGIPANAAMRLYYRSKDVTFNGKISGNGAGLSSVDADRLQGLQASQFLRSDTGNSRVPMGSTSSTNWDGLVYDDSANTLAFFADQDTSADTPRVLLGPGWVEAGGRRLAFEQNVMPKNPKRTTIFNGSVGSGTIQLSQNWDNFDALIFYISNDDGINGAVSVEYRVSDLIASAKLSGNRGHIQCGGYDWIFDINNRSVITDIYEDCIMKRIIGVNYS